MAKVPMTLVQLQDALERLDEKVSKFVEEVKLLKESMEVSATVVADVTTESVVADDAVPAEVKKTRKNKKTSN